MTVDTSTPPLPSTLLLVGSSMAPTLPPGSRLRVEPLEPLAPLHPGDVIVLRSAGVFVVHRHLALFGSGREHVVHAGDAGGGLGVAARAAVAGRVVGLAAGPLPEPAPAVRARLARARRRARLYVWLRRVARTLGGPRLAALGRSVRSRLLRVG